MKNKNTNKIDIIVIEKILTLIYHICESNNIKYLIKRKKVKLPYYKFLYKTTMDFYDKEFDVPIIRIPDLMEMSEMSNNRDIINDIMILYNFIYNYFSYKKTLEMYASEASFNSWEYSDELNNEKKVFDERIDLINKLNEKYT